MAFTMIRDKTPSPTRSVVDEDGRVIHVPGRCSSRPLSVVVDVGRFSLGSAVKRSGRCRSLAGGMSDTSQGPGWWQASDRRWYPPDQQPAYLPPPPPPPPPSPMTPSPYSTTPWLAPTVRPVTDGLAIASLVLSILWLGGLGSLAAVIVGFVALTQIRSAQGRKRGRGLATSGLVIGVIGLAGAIGLYATIGFANTSTTQANRIRSLNVAAVEKELIYDTLQRSDFPSGWSSEGGPNGIPGGVPAANLIDVDSVAKAFGSCVDKHSSLLDQNGPVRRVESPLFYSESAGIVQNLVTLEPSITAARGVAFGVIPKP